MKTILTCLLLVLGAVVALSVLPNVMGAVFGLSFTLLGIMGGAIVAVGATVFGLGWLSVCWGLGSSSCRSCFPSY